MEPRKFQAIPWSTDSRRKKMTPFRLKARIRRKTAMKPEPLWRAAAKDNLQDQRGSTSVSPFKQARNHQPGRRNLSPGPGLHRCCQPPDERLAGIVTEWQRTHALDDGVVAQIEQSKIFRYPDSPVKQMGHRRQKVMLIGNHQNVSFPFEDGQLTVQSIGQPRPIEIVPQDLQELIK